MKNLLQSSLKMVFFSAIFLISTFNTFAQNWNQLIKITAQNNGGSSARTAEDWSSYSVSMSGDYAIVGAFNEDADANGLNNVSNTGAAYILFNNAGNWTQIKKITAPVRGVGNAFGISVAIEGDYAIVGAKNEAEDALEVNPVQDAGAAYIFRKDQGGTNNWGFVKKIAAPIRAVADQFGNSVAISGDYIIVGAFSEDEDANELNTLNDSGAAYIFKKDQGGTDNWGLIKKITASTRAADDWFGFSVSINGDYAVLSAHQEDEDALEANTLSFSGSAYIFKKDQGGTDNWGQIKKITAAIRAVGDTFGTSVSINGDYIMVGAPAEKEDASETNSLTSAGAAYIFKKDQGGADNWGQIKKLVPTIRATNDGFGFAVSINGGYAFAGATAESEDVSEANTLFRAGAAYIFKKNQGGTDGWGQVQKIVPSSRAVGDEFGISISISGSSAIVGAWMEDEDASEANTILNAGSVYIFNTTDPLPVTLKTFEAIKNENQALLKWTTTTEANTDYFEIQKSGNDLKWQPLSRVPAAVNSNNLRSYSFTDPDLSDENSPGFERLYRLKMVDLDGSFAYSRIVSLSFGNYRRTILYPNPVSDQLYSNPADAAKIESITIINSAGQIMFQSFEYGKAGIPINRLTPGTYLAQIRKKTGMVQFQKIVVVR